MRVKKSSDNAIGAILRKHAGDYLWGLIKEKGVEVWESEEGCRSILKLGKEGIARGEGRIARYNEEQMIRALNEIRQFKD